jgi:molybdate transport system ATP-binding protein
MFSVRLQRALPGFALDVDFHSERDAGVVALTGPSGAGKTSVLRCIAGLWRPDAGRIAVGERVLLDTRAGVHVPAHERRVGVVFQDARLFPHMDVRANLRYGMRADRPPLLPFDEAISLLGIDGLLARRPAGLSGGERQRVAIGRALLAGPELLLLDEPLASLDQARKDELLRFLAALPGRLRVPLLCVTHSLDEVLLLADEVVALEGGRVRAHGAVHAVAPALIGGRDDDSVLEGRITRATDDELAVEVGGHALVCLARRGGAAGERVRIRVRAEDVLLAAGPVSGLSVRNRLPARVEAVDRSAGGARVDLRIDGADALHLAARISAGSADRLGLAPGVPVTALVKAAALQAFPNRAG